MKIPKSIKNEVEFIKLMHRYKSLTLDEIEEVWKRTRKTEFYTRAGNTLNKLTGFGQYPTCSLCRVCETDYYNNNCRYCVYSLFFNNGKMKHCKHHSLGKSYEAIKDAKSSGELLIAIHDRAELMQKLYDRYKSQLEAT